MELSLFDKYEKTQPKKRSTERGDLLDYFLSRLNPGRIKAGYQPLNHGRLSFLLAKIPTKDLYYLQGICNDANDFSKKFWWEINPKNH